MGFKNKNSYYVEKSVDLVDNFLKFTKKVTKFIDKSPKYVDK